MIMQKTPVIGLLGTGFALASMSLYRYVFYRNRSKLSERLLTPKTHSEEFYRQRQEAAAAMDALPHEKVHIRSLRGERLDGYYYPAAGSSGKKVCYFVHGYRGNHTSNAGPYVRYYLDQGIDVFSEDHVACGTSEGNWIGYDFFESEDCLQWIEFLREKCGEDVEIILHGFSLGGATVLKVSDHCPDNVKLIISDSGFASAKDVILPGIRPVQLCLDLINRAVAGYRLKDTDVRPNVASTLLPILFMHGTEDETVPLWQAEELYAICSSPDKHLFTVFGARHVEAEFVDPDGYYRILDDYIEKYLEND